MLSLKLASNSSGVDGRRADFADHDARRVIGKNRRFHRRSSRRNRQRESRDHGVARAGHIENFLRHGRNVKRLSARAGTATCPVRPA